MNEIHYGNLHDQNLQNDYTNSLMNDGRKQLNQLLTFTNEKFHLFTMKFGLIILKDTAFGSNK